LGGDGLPSDDAEGRVSLFAQGSIFGGYDVTGSYDSARGRQDRLWA
jgi:hypothetical protein